MWNDEAHLTTTRCTPTPYPYQSAVLISGAVYRPNVKAKSDADIMRDAKLEAMGMRPDDHEHRRTSDRAQMATDEIVSSRCCLIVTTLTPCTLGHGALQEADAQVRSACA